MNFASGCCALSAAIFRELNVSCTMQAPGHRIHLAAGLLDEERAEVLVGAEQDRAAFGHRADDLLGVARRADDVALGLRRALQLMYITT
jgi:hypothetical protein